MHRFVTAKGWYEANSARPQTPRNIATSRSSQNRLAMPTPARRAWGVMSSRRIRVGSYLGILGGWQAPASFLGGVPSWLWFFGKLFALLGLFVSTAAFRPM